VRRGNATILGLDVEDLPLVHQIVIKSQNHYDTIIVNYLF
jgi:hypothetical protein